MYVAVDEQNQLLLGDCIGPDKNTKDVWGSPDIYICIFIYIYIHVYIYIYITTNISG